MLCLKRHCKKTEFNDFLMMFVLHWHYFITAFFEYTDYSDRNRAKVFRHARKEHPQIKLKERESVPRYFYSIFPLHLSFREFKKIRSNTLIEYFFF